MADASDAYPVHLQRCVDKLSGALTAADSKQAIRLAQDLAGEAPTLGWPLAGEVAKQLRDILETDTLARQSEAASLAFEMLRRVISEDRQKITEEDQILLASLKTMTQKLAKKGAIHGDGER